MWAEAREGEQHEKKGAKSSNMKKKGASASAGRHARTRTHAPVHRNLLALLKKPAPNCYNHSLQQQQQRLSASTAASTVIISSSTQHQQQPSASTAAAALTAVAA